MLGRLTVRFLLASALLTATSCTMFHGPDAELPSRNGLMAGPTITVQPNENIYTIARSHNVAMREIIVLNDLKAPFVVKAGQQLVLPAAAGESAPVPVAAPSGDVQKVNLDKIEAQPLPPPTKPDNNHDNNIVPAGVMAAPLAAAPVVLSGSGASSASSAGTAQAGVATQPASAPVYATNAPQSVAPAASAASATQTASAGTIAAPSFAIQWPIKGPTLSGFGPKGQGLNNDGVNIGAPKGSPVSAAANGIVVYAGNEMKGFGNLILIRHEDGWVTAYAYLDRVLVSKDAVVAKGDMIGTVGKTGSATTPQLHFETRYQGKPVDPVGVIK
ncbi:MAG: M23 family metallopeptidase [Alphaproteobacteria bacterium]|nr:M23 family metallopeptidase [Alphaproteobacteria bacterium]